MAKADVTKLPPQPTGTPTAPPQAAASAPLVPPAATTTPSAVPETLGPPAAAPPRAEPISDAPTGGEAPEPDVQTRTRKPLRLLVAGAVVLLAVAAAGWWFTTGGAKEEDPCVAYREELQQVQARDHENSREERRAVAEVIGRAHDAGCDLDDPPRQAAPRPRIL